MPVLNWVRVSTVASPSHRAAGTMAPFSRPTGKPNPGNTWKQTSESPNPQRHGIRWGEARRSVDATERRCLRLSGTPGGAPRTVYQPMQPRTAPHRTGPDRTAPHRTVSRASHRCPGLPAGPALLNPAGRAVGYPHCADRRHSNGSWGSRLVTNSSATVAGPTGSGPRPWRNASPGRGRKPGAQHREYRADARRVHPPGTGPRGGRLRRLRLRERHRSAAAGALGPGSRPAADPRCVGLREPDGVRPHARSDPAGQRDGGRARVRARPRDRSRGLDRGWRNRDAGADGPLDRAGCPFR